MATPRQLSPEELANAQFDQPLSFKAGAGGVLYDPSQQQVFQAAPGGVLTEAAGPRRLSPEELAGAQKAFDPNAPDLPSAIAGGLARGLTFGFLDEISGLAAGKDTSYALARDTEREREKKLREAYPGTSIASELVGGALVPGIGAAGGGIAGAAKAGAAMGALAGAGESEASTAGGVVGDIAKGAALGAGVGAGIGLVGKGIGAVAKGAVNRIKEREFAALAKNAPAESKLNLVANKDAVLNEVESQKWNKLISKPRELSGAVQSEISTAKEAARIAQSEVDRVAQSTEGQAIVDKLQGIRNRLSSAPGNEGAVAKLDKTIESIQSRWVPAKPMSDADILKNAVVGAAPNEAQKMASRVADTAKAIRAYDLEAKLADPEAFAVAANEVRDTVGARIGAVYDTVEGAVENSAIPLKGAMKKLDALYQDLAKIPSPENKAKATALRSFMEDVWSTWGSTAEKGAAEASIRDLRALTTSVQKGAWGGNLLEPTTSRELGRQISGVLKETVDDHLASLAKKIPELRGPVSELSGLNREYSVLSTIADVAEKRALASRTKAVKMPAAKLAPAGTSGEVRLNDLRSLREAVGADSPASSLLESEISRLTSTAPEQASRLGAAQKRLGILEDLNKAAQGADVAASIKSEPLGVFLEPQRIPGLMAQKGLSMADRLVAAIVRRAALGESQSALMKLAKATGISEETARVAIDTGKNLARNTIARQAGGAVATSQPDVAPESAAPKSSTAATGTNPVPAWRLPSPRAPLSSSGQMIVDRGESKRTARGASGRKTLGLRASFQPKARP